jgi:hypothetical protein
MSNVLDAFAASFDRCWLCGVKGMNTWPPSLETHHIVRGSDRTKSLNERCALIRTCQRCHTNRLDGMSVVRQLAIKLMCDPDGYSRECVNKLRGRAPEAITEGEVLLEVYELKNIMGEREYIYPRWVF